MIDNIDKLITKDKKRIKDKKTKNIGRPKKDDSERKDNKVVTYLTKKEFQILEKITKENDLTISQMARKMLVKALKDKS